MNKEIERIINERVTPEHATENGYMLDAQEIIYMAHQGIAAGYGMQFKYYPYKLNDYTNKLPKPLQEMVKKLIDKYTNGRINGIWRKPRLVETKVAYEKLAIAAYECGKAYKEAEERFIREYEI